MRKNNKRNLAVRIIGELTNTVDSCAGTFVGTFISTVASHAGAYVWYEYIEPLIKPRLDQMMKVPSDDTNRKIGF